MRIVSASEMVSIDKTTIDKVGLPGIVLMENAGRAFVQRFCQLVSKDTKVVIVCGPGNNGGDGFCVARYLRESNYEVVCLALKPVEVLKGEAKIQAEVYKRLYGDIKEIDTAEEIADSWWGAEIIIEAIFGTGLTKKIEGRYLEIINKINSSGLDIWAVDLPSGIDANTGQVLGQAVSCVKTLTLGLAKWGVFVEPGRTCAGEVEVLDIGFPERVIAELAGEDIILDDKWAREVLPHRPRAAHKGTFGTVWIIGGCQEYVGAPVLSSLAALRSGAGKVILIAPDNLCSKLGGNYPEIIRFSGSEPTKNILGEELLSRLKDLPESKSICLGPGIGRNLLTNLLIANIIENSRVPVVVDADALWHVAQLSELKSRCQHVFTPHLAELANLLKMDIEDILQNLPYFAKLASEKFSCILVCKGNPTIISDGKKCYLNSGGGPVLSQAGTGDILAGLIAGLIAQGMEPMIAASLGVFVHSRAGEISAERLADRGVLAGEICANIPLVFRELYT